MSKAQLKKELTLMTKEQIIEVVTEMYSLRKDAKEYFEYYLNPDVNKLFRTYEEKIFTELKRVKRHHYREESKARITTVKRAIKEFDSFGSGKEWTTKLMFDTVESALILSSTIPYTTKYAASLGALLQDTMLEADACGHFNEYAGRIVNFTRLDKSGLGAKWLREIYLRSLHEIGMQTEYIDLLPPIKMSKKTLSKL